VNRQAKAAVRLTVIAAIVCVSALSRAISTSQVRGTVEDASGLQGRSYRLEVSKEGLAEYAQPV
jgi:hypothetical protein